MTGPVIRESASSLAEAQLRERVLAVVRAAPGILTERVAAAACCSVFDAVQALTFWVSEDAVEELVAAGADASIWIATPWCLRCGCTEMHACEGGCGWRLEPGTLRYHGDGAGVCTRCA